MTVKLRSSLSDLKRWPRALKNFASYGDVMVINRACSQTNFRSMDRVESAFRNFTSQWQLLHSWTVIFHVSRQKKLIYLNFLYPILNMVQKTNKNFESKVADPTKLLLDIKRLYSTIAIKFYFQQDIGAHKCFFCERMFISK